ncbi:Xylose isomerase [Armadillidium vulgare]|nr:Xylose isomerase [Armadillidium vulgare]
MSIKFSRKVKRKNYQYRTTTTGENAHIRPFDDGSKTVENYKRRIEAAFEFYDKLNLRWYSISDRDLCPDFDNFEETVRLQDEICNLVIDLQKQYNIRPLYFGCDLFSHPRYANGSMTNPDSHIFAYACSQMKRALEMAKRLDAENFLFFHPRDGYQSLIQRQVFRDIQHIGNFYRMALQYKDKINYRGQFVIQPKPFEPKRFQYESDVMSVIAILRHHELEKYFKLFIKPGSSRMMGRPYEHDVYMASSFKMLNGIDASDNYPEIRSSTDVVPVSIRDATSLMKCVLEQGGFTNGGGINLGFRIRREAIDIRDQIHAYILAMDTFARALRNAARILHDGFFKKSLNQVRFEEGI